MACQPTSFATDKACHTPKDVFENGGNTLRALKESNSGLKTCKKSTAEEFLRLAQALNYPCSVDVNKLRQRLTLLKQRHLKANPRQGEAISRAPQHGILLQDHTFSVTGWVKKGVDLEADSHTGAYVIYITSLLLIIIKMPRLQSSMIVHNFLMCI